METKRPFLFLLPAATLSFPPAMDPGGDLGETIGPLQHQEGGPRIIAVRKLGSLGLFFFPDVIEFAGPLPLPATCGSAQSLCRTFHALKIPLVSLSDENLLCARDLVTCFSCLTFFKLHTDHAMRCCNQPHLYR